MRLICPNCSAEYEVDSAAIPDTGRDVQCSNCGHAWFQMPAAEAEEVAVAEPAAELAEAGTEAAAAPYDDRVAPTEEPPAPDLPPAAAAPEEMVPGSAAAGVVSEDATAADESPLADSGMDRVANSLDETVLAVLREEAERETNARKAETSQPIEVQPELGLAAAAAAPAIAVAAAPRGGLPDFSDLNDEAAAAAAKADPGRPAARRDLFPDIEEINSTLSPGAETEIDPTAFPPPPRQRSGFRNGFVLMLLVAGILTAAYAFAPRIIAQVPGAKAPLDAYVAAVDNGRLWLDGMMRNAITALRGLAEGGGEG